MTKRSFILINEALKRFENKHDEVLTHWCASVIWRLIHEYMLGNRKRRNRVKLMLRNNTEWRSKYYDPALKQYVASATNDANIIALLDSVYCGISTIVIASKVQVSEKGILQAEVLRPDGVTEFRSISLINLAEYYDVSPRTLNNVLSMYKTFHYDAIFTLWKNSAPVRSIPIGTITDGVVQLKHYAGHIEYEIISMLIDYLFVLPTRSAVDTVYKRYMLASIVMHSLGFDDETVMFVLDRLARMYTTRMWVEYINSLNQLVESSHVELTLAEIPELGVPNAVSSFVTKLCNGDQNTFHELALKAETDMQIIISVAQQALEVLGRGSSNDVLKSISDNLVKLAYGTEDGNNKDQSQQTSTN